MDEVQRDRNDTIVPQANEKPGKEKRPKRELALQQVRQHKRMIVFPLMFLAFTGYTCLIFAPTNEEDANVESAGGFNADIPLPAEDGIIADRQRAYERAVINHEQRDRIQSLQDFGFTGDNEAEGPQTEADLMSGGDPEPQRGGGASSQAAYRSVSCQLNTSYGIPAVDREEEDLRRQVVGLTDRLQQQQNITSTTNDQVTLLEKSYELVTRYMNDDGQNGQTAQVPAAGGIGHKLDVVTVQATRETTISGLRQPMSDANFTRAYSQPRNYDFNTAVGTGYTTGKSTVATCICQDRALMSGQTVRLRLLELMQVGGIIVPKDTLVAGTAKVQSERLDMLVPSVGYAGSIISVELVVFDTDGQKGLSVPPSMEQEASNEIMANIGSGLGTSISFTRGAGQQVAVGMTRGLLQGAPGYLAKRFRAMEVGPKARYKMMLYAR